MSPWRWYKTYDYAADIVRLYGGRAWPWHVKSAWSLARQDVERDFPPDSGPRPSDPKEVLVEAAISWYDKLIEQGHFKPGEASTFNPLRSDRWPPEVDLAAAIEKYKESIK